MGGCWCCLFQDVEPQRASQEVVPLSSQNGSATAVALGLLINTIPETSAANECITPPTPVTHNLVIEYPRRADDGVEVDRNKTDAFVQTANSVSVEESVGGNHQERAETDKDPKLSECKAPPLVPEAEGDSEVEISEIIDPVMASEEECPTCLDEYDDDNPKIITRCNHHFHLVCILEWMERSNTCPMCNKEMAFSFLTNKEK